MKDLIIHDVAQGSGMWLEVRAGKATASAFNKILTAAKLQYSAQADGYEDRCVAELLTGDPIEDFEGTAWVDRGKELEPQACAAFEFQTGKTVQKVGFISRGMFGFSPDGLIGDREGWLKGTGEGVELKCPAPQTHVGYLLDGKLPDAYKMQIQGSLWVSRFQSWHFMSFHPKITPFIIEVKPDPQVQEAITAAAAQFEQNVREKHAKILGMVA